MTTSRTENAPNILALTSLAALSLLSIGPGCGGSQETPQGPSTDVAVEEGPKKPRSGVSAEIGALDEGKVKAAFKRVTDKLLGCYGTGTQRVPYLSGDVSFKVRVTQEGRARWIYVKDSTLGDRATEACMIDALKAITWPTPVDGEDGLAENSFSFAPSSDERMPVDWSPEQLGKPYVEAKPKLKKCRANAGAGPLKATFYVGTDGKPDAIGVSSADEKGEAAVQCVIDTLSGIKFPSPGSFASKVSVMID